MSRKRYCSVKDSGVPWLGTVPDHWSVYRLKRLATLVTEKAQAQTAPVALENIEGWTGHFRPSETQYEGDGTAFKAGDVLFGKLRPYLAKVFLCESSGEAVGDFHVVRPASEMAGRFLQYLMLTREFIVIVDGSTYGAKMPRASWDFMGQLELPKPPLPEQRAIAAFLDRETAKIDALVAEQERLIALLAEKRRAVISHAVTKGLDPNAPMKDSGIEWLGEVPAHWDVRRLGTLFKEVADEGFDGLPILSVSIHDGVSDRELNDEELDRKVTRSDDLSKYRRVEPGDLVYNMMRAWQGGFGTVKVAGMVSPAYVIARPLTDLNASFVEHVLRTPCAIEEMRRNSKGVTDFRLRLYWDEFKHIEVAVPPAMEQSLIERFLCQRTSTLDALTTEAERAIALLKERRAALISAAVTGKIDVRETVEVEEAAA